MKGVFLDLDSMHPQDLDLSDLEKSLTKCVLHATTTPDELVPRIADADVIISNKVVINEIHMQAAKNLKLICVAATGYNNIDINAATRLGITVANARGYATASVVEHVFGLMLALTRNLFQHHRAAHDGQWQRSPYFCVLDYPMVELNALTLGIVGYGELGRGVAQMAGAFGMKVLVAQSLQTTNIQPSSSGDRVPLDDLLRIADIVTLHCPLSEFTQNLISTRELTLMKKSAFLINTARGGIVDESALASALRAGQIAGAGIDVLSKEPPIASNPLLANDIPNLILTPHVAWAGQRARQELLNEITRNINAFANGTPRNCVR
ncbi:MAG: D-2-hydroxyacid dehydrogenase [Gammaproteobacteria bacterium]|nr:D-2-hydroxyacid dehydrogenase [Gammaproteobacteria bacterium]